MVIIVTTVAMLLLNPWETLKRALMLHVGGEPQQLVNMQSAVAKTVCSRAGGSDDALPYFSDVHG